MAPDSFALATDLSEDACRTVTLGAIAAFINGDRGENYPKQSDYVHVGVPFISAADLANGMVEAEQCSHITEEAFDRLRGGKVQDGDILFCLRGSLGKVARISRMPKGAIASSLVIIRATEHVDRSYLFYVLSGPVGQRLAKVLNNGSVQPNISARSLQESVVLLPSLSAQRKIAHILGTFDARIELNRRMNETLEAMARALFKSWFVDFDPVRARSEGRAAPGTDAETARLFPNELVDSESGPIPKGWRMARLAELTDKIGSGATPRGGDKAYVDQGASFIRSQNVYDSSFIWEGLVRITDDDAARLAGVTVQRDDVLLNITGASMLRTCVVDPLVLPARVNQHVAIIRARPGIPARYLHNHLLRSTTKSHLLGMDAGASRQAVTKGHIESVPILEPPDRILAVWGRLVAPLFSEIERLSNEASLLVHTRDALLPKLLSGEIAIPDAEHTLKVAGTDQAHPPPARRGSRP